MEDCNPIRAFFRQPGLMGSLYFDHPLLAESKNLMDIALCPLTLVSRQSA